MSAGKLTIMIVDDDRDDRFFFRKALMKMPVSFELEEAVDGVDALAKLGAAEKLPDLIFLDINMPLMNGIEFLKEIKKEDNLKNIPVIMQSTSNAEVDMAVTQNLGALEYVVKPMDVSEIPGLLEGVLRRCGYL